MFQAEAGAGATQHEQQQKQQEISFNKCYKLANCSKLVTMNWETEPTDGSLQTDYEKPIKTAEHGTNSLQSSTDYRAKNRNHNRAKLFWMSANWPTIFLLWDNFLSLFCGLPQSNVKIATQRFISSKTEQTAQRDGHTDSRTDRGRDGRSDVQLAQITAPQLDQREGGSVSWSKNWLHCPRVNK